MRHGTTAIGGVIAAALALNGCSSTSVDTSRDEVAKGFLAVADKAAATGGTLRVYLDYDSVETDGLDPRTTTTARSWSLLGLTYQTLVKADEKFGFVPGLATSWDRPNPTTYVFHLRDDAVFSNGRAMTPDDVKGSIEMLQATKSSWALQLGPLQAVEVTGAHDVTIRLKSPYTALLGALANTPAAILPVKEVRDGTVDLKTTMVGTGPFVPVAHKQDESWTFTKNARYYGAKNVGIDTLKIQIVPDEANRLAAIRDGSADYAFFNNVDVVDQLAGATGVKVVNQQNTDFYYVILNSRNPRSPLADQRVRFAVNAAIDRAQLSALVLGGRALATGVTPVTLPGACDPKKLPSAQLTDDQLRALLDAAGAKNITLSLTTFNSESAPARIAQVIQQQLKPFGITVDIKIVDDATYGAAFYGGDKPAAADIGISWYAGYGDAAMVSRWWDTGEAKFTARFLAGSSKLNTLVEGASKEPAGDARAKTFTALCEEVDRTAEQVPLVTRPGVIAYRSDQVSPTINADEGYGDVLRYLTDFRLVAKS